MIKITLKDGKIMEFEEGIKISDIAMKISPALYKKSFSS